MLRVVSATNETDRDIRRGLNDDYHVVYVISSHDPSRGYFSENDKQIEVLLVCQQKGLVGEHPPSTRVVNLARNPSGLEDAKTTARAILHGPT